MHKVTSLIERFEASTEPFEGIMNNIHAFIKVFNCRWSNKVLINEFVCLELAKLLNLPIPNGGICIIDKDTDINAVIDYIDYDEDINGIAFYSERLYNISPNLNSLSVFNNIINKNDINKIILFDHLIYNVDRHNGNLLIQWGSDITGFKMYIIDHSHVFNLNHQWNAANLSTLILNQDFKDLEILNLNYPQVYKFFYESNIIDRVELEKQVEFFKAVITEEQLDKIISKIPSVWISQKDDLLKLKEYIIYRLNNLDYMKNMIIDYKQH